MERLTIGLVVELIIVKISGFMCFIIDEIMRPALKIGFFKIIY